METLEERALLSTVFLDPQAASVFAEVGTPAGITRGGVSGDSNVIYVNYQLANLFGATGEFVVQGANQSTGNAATPQVLINDSTRPASLVTLNAAMAQHLPQGARAGDLLYLQWTGEIGIVRPPAVSGGGWGGPLQFDDVSLRGLLGQVQLTDVFDVGTGTVHSFSGTLNISSSGFKDVAVHAGNGFTDLLVTGLSPGPFPFIVRMRYAQGEFQNARVIVASTGQALSASDTDPVPGIAPGVAVNPQGTVLTTLPTPLPTIGATYRVVAFGAEFPEGNGPTPREVFDTVFWSQGITTTSQGDFVLTSLPAHAGRESFEFAVVRRDLSVMAITPFSNIGATTVHVGQGTAGPTLGFYATVDSSDNTVYITTNLEGSSQGLISHPFMRVIRASLTVPPPPPPSTSDALQPDVLVVGADAGGMPRVRVFDASTQQERFNFLAFPSAFRGGVRVAVADVTGDGVPDIIAAPGPGRPGLVRIFSSIDGRLIRQHTPFGTDYEGGLFVAAADVTGNGVADVAVGRESGRGLVRVFQGAFGPLLRGLSPFGPDYRGGVTLAAADVNGNGQADLVVGTRRNQTTVRLVSGRWLADGSGPTFLGAFHAFGQLTTGVYVAAADVTGNGRADLIVGRATGVGQVRVFDGGSRARLSTFNAFPDGGVRVAAGDVTGDGRFDILAAAGPGRVPLVRVYDGQSGERLAQFLAENQQFRRGLQVSALASGLPGAASALLVEGDALPHTADLDPLTQAQLSTIVVAAIDRFALAGLDDESLERLRNVSFAISDLDGRVLGLSSPGRVLLDRYAAGYGWFVDPTPHENEEFARGTSGQWDAVDDRAERRIDLLTVVMHELGHQLGLGHSHDAHDVMHGTLSPGVRRELDDTFASEELFEALLFPAHEI